MAATGYTPISLYYSTTASAVPTAGNLADGELALNIADMKLYAKNSSGAVTLLASNSGATGTVSSVAVSGGTTGLTTSGGPITTSGTITLAGTLATTNGGTGLTSFTANGVLYASSTSALTSGSALTFDGTNFVVNNGYLRANNTLGYYTNLTATGLTNFATTMDFDSVGSYLFKIASSEQMRLTSTGLGIGTSSPAGKLHVVGRSYFQPASGQTTAITLMNTSGGDGNILVTGTSTTMNYSFNTYSTSNALYVDNAGNVGLSTTPSAVGSYKVMEINGTTGGLLYMQSTGTRVMQLYGASTEGGLWVIANGALTFGTNNTERFRFGASGQFGIGGANYGTSGQVLTSQGSGAAPTWATAAGGAQAFVAFGTTGESNFASQGF